MYITETTDNVRNLFEKIDDINDISKLKFILYTFSLLNNNQINNKNEANPNLIEDDELIIFNLESIGLPLNHCTIFLQYNIMIYNILAEDNIYEDNGNVIGLNYNKEEKLINSCFESCNFKEKLDVFSELIIRYETENYFEEKITMITFNSKISAFDIAKLINKYKLNL